MRPPRLMRRTPQPAMSDSGAPVAMMFTGLGATACTIARTCASSRTPGAKAVGAGVRVSLETADHRIQIRLAMQEGFGPRSQHHAAAALVDRLARSRHPHRSQVFRIQRFIWQTGGVFHRQAGNAGLHRERDIGGDIVGRMRKRILEIGIDRQIDGGDEAFQMTQHLVAADAVIRPRLTPGKARAGGGQRLEAEALQQHGRAGIEGIRHDEAAAFMQAAEGGTFIGEALAHGVSPPKTELREQQPNAARSVATQQYCPDCLSAVRLTQRQLSRFSHAIVWLYLPYQDRLTRYFPQYHVSITS
jgi:hypothetical protein